MRSLAPPIRKLSQDRSMHQVHMPAVPLLKLASNKGLVGEFSY